MLLLFVHDLFNRYSQSLLLHLFEPYSDIIVFLEELFVRYAWTLLNDSLHDLLVFSVYSLCFLPLYYVVQGSRRLDSLCKDFLLNRTLVTSYFKVPYVFAFRDLKELF